MYHGSDDDESLERLGTLTTDLIVKEKNPSKFASVNFMKKWKINQDEVKEEDDVDDSTLKKEIGV